MKLAKQLLGLLVVAALAACATTACHSTDNSSSNPLLVRSENPSQISEAVTQEFEKAGFLVAAPGLTKMTYERRGSGMKTLAYGDWLGGAVWERVKVAVVPVGPDEYRLDLQAFLVRDRGGLTEEETRAGKGKYEEILKRAVQRVGS